MSSLSNVIEFPGRHGHERPIEPLLIEERQRIARELHDVVSYGFATISVNAAVALNALDEQPQQALEALAAIKTASGEALRELRRILGALRPSDQDAPAPGLARLDALVASTTAAGVPTAVRIHGRPRTLPAAVDLAAFRVVQESLTNVLRYGGRVTAVVTIGYERDALTVNVVNDGEPLAGPIGLGAGSGIAGMRERVRALGGYLEAAPRPGGGFCVDAHLPVLGRP
jgi:signal transduction histidine kinase